MPLDGPEERLNLLEADFGDVDGARLRAYASDGEPGVLDDGLYRRLRVFLRTGPLHRLRELASRQTWPTDRLYDSELLGVVAFDAVVTRAGLADEFDFDGLVVYVAQLAQAVEPEASAHEWDAIAEWVVRSLLGEGDASGFVVAHGDFRGGYHRSELRWRLLYERMRADGRVVLEATTDGINALRAGLDLDVEDAQLAQETVLRAQLERGDLRGAESSAEAAHRLSLELAAKLRDLVDAIRFNLDTVDWEVDFQSKVSRALEHVSQRIRAEHHMLEHLAAGVDVEDEVVRRRTVSIRGTIERCLARHRDLHRLLQRAPETFLAEQVRQVLPGRRQARLRLSLQDDLLVPVLSGSARGAFTVGSTFALRSIGCSHVQIFDLSTMLDRLLRPPRAEPEGIVPEDPFEDLVEEPPDEVADEFLRAATALVATCHSAPRLLSELLTEAPGPEVAEVVRLLALMLFDPEDVDVPGGELAALAGAGAADLISVPAGRAFSAAGYRGDDLRIGQVGVVLGEPEVADKALAAQGAPR
jgi:hypothetical protein